MSLIIAWVGVLVGTNITTEFFRSNSRSYVLAAIIVVVTLLSFHRSDLYVVKPTPPRTEEISRVLRGIALGLGTGIVAAAFTDWPIGAWEVVIGFVTASILVVINRGFLRYVGDLLPGHHEPARVVVVGTGIEARELVELIMDHKEAQLSLVGVIGNLPVARETGMENLWIGPTSRLTELMHIHQATGAIVTPTGFRTAQFRQITTDLFNDNFDVHLSTGVSRLREGRFDLRSLAHEPIIVLGTQRAPRWQKALKRAMDVVGGSIALILASPFMLLTALAIKIEDRGPVLFCQDRAGRDAQFFGMYKFRSMVTNAEELKAELEADNERSGPLFKVTHDPRITRVGRIIRELSIDELPQLFNVIKGDMSMVGPRPALTEEEEAFDDELRGRFDVRPGITGLWQVEARSNASFAAYRRLDLHYVENWNIGLDIRIILATIEQLVVTAAMLPVSLVLRRRNTEQIVSNDHGRLNDIIDIRDRSTARLVAEEQSLTEDAAHPTQGT